MKQRTYAHRPTRPESVVACVVREPSPPVDVPRDLAIKLKRRLEEYSLFDLRSDLVTGFKYVNEKNKREAETILVALQAIARGNR